MWAKRTYTPKWVRTLEEYSEFNAEINVYIPVDLMFVLWSNGAGELLSDHIRRFQILHNEEDGLWIRAWLQREIGARKVAPEEVYVGARPIK